MQKTQLNNLPDLPELESVELRNWQMLAVIGGFVCFYVLIPLPPMVWTFLNYRKYLPGGVIWALVAYAALGGWVIFRLLTSAYCFRTDRTGLTVGGILARRSVEWSQVESAEMPEGLSNEASIRLHTHSGDLVVGPGLRSVGSDVLLASIWQHIRRVGKEEGVEPTPRALSLWDTIPDDLPRELEWGKPPSRAQWLLMAILVLIFGALPVGLWYDPPTRLFTRIYLGFVTLASLATLVAVARAWARQATRVCLRDEELEAQTSIRTVHLPWSEVDHAGWRQTYIVIGSRKLRSTVSIPYFAGREDSERLILGLIRKLRAIDPPQALTIPDALRRLASVAPRDAAGRIEPVELKLSRSDVFLIFVMLGLFCVALGFAIITGVHAHWLAAAAVALAIGLISLFTRYAARSYSVTANDLGITRSFLGRKKVIRWEEITSCVPSSVPKERMRGKKALKNAKGKTLMDFPPGVGTAEDRLAFTAFIEAKLAASTPVDTFSKPWLARPFPPSQPPTTS